MYDLELHSDDYGWVEVASDVCLEHVATITAVLDRANVHFRWRRRIFDVLTGAARTDDTSEHGDQSA